MHSLLNELNEEQQKAVLQTEGPVLILAGAGSGKTKTLTHRIAYLIDEKKVSPQNILAVTFTNKAAKEMRVRLASLLGDERLADDRAFMPFMGTFHGICVRLLRFDGEHIGVPKNFIIFDEDDRISAVKQAMKQLGITDKAYTPRGILSCISSAKNELITPSEYKETASLPLQRAAASVYPIYEQIRKDTAALDFDDLLIETVRLMKTVPEIRAKWSTRFQYVMIDEYQDTNNAQYTLVKLLVNDHHNLCVVGDDWQCLLPGTPIETARGVQKIEDVVKGDLVKSASGYGNVSDFAVLARKQFNYKGNLVRLKTATGKELICTPKHLLFVREQGPHGATEKSAKRTTVDVLLFGDKHGPELGSQLIANADQRNDLSVFERLGYEIEILETGAFQVEIRDPDYGKIEQVVDRIRDEGTSEVQVAKCAFITDKKAFFMPAGQIHPGMLLPILSKGKMVEDEITSVDMQAYDGPVYDLDVDKVHNYIASGIAVHNSIYSWRGADFRNILKFEHDYTKTTVIKLEQNYRSTKHILDAAHKIITKNEQRSDKQLWTDVGDGQPVKIHHAMNEYHEGDIIVQTIKSVVDLHARRYGEYAILYRTNAQSRSVEEAFIRNGVPYRMVGGQRFYDRKEIRDLIAYLRLLYQPADRPSFTRIVNVPTRGLGTTSVERFLQWQSMTGLTIVDALFQVQLCPDLQARARKALFELGEMLQKLSEYASESSVADLVDAVIRRTEYEKYLQDGTVQAESRIENIKELVSVAREYEAQGLSGFLEEVALVSDLDSMEDRADAVTLMTLHAAKGLEFPVVFMIGMEESVFPHSRALFDADEMEEERRLCYVGMTRAKEELHLVSAASRMLFGTTQHNPPSRFLSELGDEATLVSSGGFGMGSGVQSGRGFGFASQSEPDEPYAFGSHEEHVVPEDECNLSVGDSVRHQVFGVGKVVSVDGDTVGISFGNRGVKKLNVQFAPLERC